MGKKDKNSDKSKIREIVEKTKRIAHRLKNSGDLTHYKKALALARTLEKTSNLAEARKLEKEFLGVLKKKYSVINKFTSKVRSEYDEPYTPPPQAEDAATYIAEMAADPPDRPTNWGFGQCATFVEDAINRYVLDDGIRVEPIGNYDDELGYACHLGDALTDAGFTQAYNSETDSQYEPQIGDVAVIQPYEGGPPYGHACMWDGTRWVSDFKQALGDTSPYPWYGSYNPPPYIIYHWPERGIKKFQRRKKSVAKAKVKDAKRKRI